MANTADQNFAKTLNHIEQQIEKYTRMKTLLVELRTLGLEVNSLPTDPQPEPVAAPQLAAPVAKKRGPYKSAKKATILPPAKKATAKVAPKPASIPAVAPTAVKRASVPWTKERMAKHRAEMKKRWADPKYKEKLSKSLSQRTNK